MIKRTKKLPPWHTLPTFWDVMRRCKHDTATWLKTNNVTDKKSLEAICASMKMSPPDWSAVERHFLAPTIKEEKKELPPPVLDIITNHSGSVDVSESTSVQTVDIESQTSDVQTEEDQSDENESSDTSDDSSLAKQRSKKKRRF